MSRSKRDLTVVTLVLLLIPSLRSHIIPTSDPWSHMVNEDPEIRYG